MLLDFDPLCPSTRCVSSAVSVWAVIRVFTQIILRLGHALLDKIRTIQGSVHILRNQVLPNFGHPSPLRNQDDYLK